MDHLHGFTTKLLSGWLPTNSRLAKLEGIPATCPNCPEPETIEHLFQCPAAADWQSALAIKLEHKFGGPHHTCPQLLTMIQTHFHAFFQKDPIYSKSIASTIRWHLVIRGFLPKSWGILQRLYRHSLATTPMPKDPYDWEISLIKFLWEELHTLWTFQNSLAHRQSNNHSSSQTRQRSETQVRALYDHRHSIGVHDRSIFSQPLPKHLCNSSTSELLAWTTTMAPAGHLAISAHTQRSIHGTHDLRDYYPYPCSLPARPRPARTNHTPENPIPSFCRCRVTSAPRQLQTRDIRDFFTPAPLPPLVPGHRRRHPTHVSISDTTGNNDHPL